MIFFSFASVTDGPFSSLTVSIVYRSTVPSFAIVPVLSFPSCRRQTSSLLPSLSLSLSKSHDGRSDELDLLSLSRIFELAFLCVP